MTCRVCKWANHPPCPKNIPCCDCAEECNSRQCVDEEPKTETKVCRTCGQELPLTEYYPQPGGVMGCKAECKRCYIERQQRKKYGQSHQVKHRPPDHQKTTREEQLERKREYMRQYHAANKAKMQEAARRCAERRRADPDAPKLKTGPKKGTAIQHQDFQHYPDRHCAKCEFYPCFDGIENLESDFASCGCHGWKEKEK